MLNLPEELKIAAQPDDTTCGPTCLHAIYTYYNDPTVLEQVIQDIDALEEGGTLAVILACHALKRGYKARIYTYNLELFDPTWFSKKTNLAQKLKAQAEEKDHPKLQYATRFYLEFLRLGGELRFKDLTPKLIHGYVNNHIPILTGLSATYLYQMKRIVPVEEREDDIQGFPEGHFVILSGYHKIRNQVSITDPFANNPVSGEHYYRVPMERLVSSILLGVLTYDANLLIIQPQTKKEKPCPR